uniref:Cocaine- and amphetamine-regulated transcript protein n=1 Tax=Anabas testudineus TaxID=64144 RepID=A0AAQ6IPM1_ANATE
SQLQSARLHPCNTSPTGRTDACWEKQHPPSCSSRLPGLCRRLKRRRVTVLCNLKTFCWSGSSDRDRSGQVCRCPRGSRCSHFFIHSL